MARTRRVAGGVRQAPSKAAATGSGPLSGDARWCLLVAVGLAALTAACYLPAMLWGGLVWDDRIWSRAPAVLRWSGLGDIWFSPSRIEGEAHYWPLVYTTLWLEHKLWGLAPAGYHIVNVALHLANTLLLWRVLERLKVPGAWVAAAVFAVHPLHVESVAWIIELKDVLSALCYLGAVWFWLRFLEEPRWRRYGLALSLFVAGLLSKSVVVTLPVALLIIRWWKDGRVTGQDVWRVAPFFAAGLLIGAGDLAYYQSLQISGSLDYSLVERSLIASRALWFYAGKLAWPADLAVIYPLWDIRVTDPWAWVYPGAVLALAAALWSTRHRLGRGPLAGALFFAVTLSPTLGFVDFSYMRFSLVADRFQYLAGIGLLAVAAAAARVAAAKLAERWGRPVLPAALLGLGVLLALLGTQTWRQSGIYRDVLTFNRHIIAHNPRARDAHRNLAAGLFKAGRVEEALEAARVAAEQYPDCSQCHAGVGAALVAAGRLDEAEDHLRRALEIDPRDESALQNSSELFRRQGRHDEALAAAEAWRKLRPYGSGPHQAMARALGGLNRHGEAEKRWRRAHEIESRNTAIVQNLAESIRKQGRYRDALKWYGAVLRVEPDAALAHAASGDVLFRLARYDEAADALARVVELAPDLPDLPSVLALAARAVKRASPAAAGRRYARIVKAYPDFPHVLFEQGVAHARQARYKEALELFGVVTAVLPDSAAAHSNRGTMLYHLGRTDEALTSFDRALAIDPEFEDARNNRRALTGGK